MHYPALDARVPLLMRIPLVALPNNNPRDGVAELQVGKMTTQRLGEALRPKPATGQLKYPRTAEWWRTPHGRHQGVTIADPDLAPSTTSFTAWHSL